MEDRIDWTKYKSVLYSEASTNVEGRLPEMKSFIKNTRRFAQERQPFIFGAIALVALTIPYSIYLTVLSQNDAKELLYLATGINTRLETFDFLVPIVTIFIFQAVALLVYSILRMGTSTILACVGAMVFLTSAQTALVFMSSPLWDMSLVIPLLTCVLLALLIVLIPTWSVSKRAESLYGITPSLFVISIVIVLILSLIIMRRGVSLLGSSIDGNATSSLIACAFIIFSIILLFFRRRIFHTLEFRRESLLLVTLTAVMTATLLIAPYTNVGRFNQGPSTLILLVLTFAPLFAPIKNQFRLRALSSLILLAGVTISGGATTGSGKFPFYMSAGWQSAPQLVSGIDNSSVIIGVPFSDAPLAAFVEQQGLGALGFLLLLAPMFILVNWSYALIAIHYIIGGTWLYPEPPVGAEGALWDGRMLFVDSVGMVSTAFGLFAILILLRSHRRVGLLLLVLLASVVLLIAFSRPQMHQWWYTSIFGVWAMLYSLNCLFRWVRGINSSFAVPIRVRTGTFLTQKSQPAIFKRTLIVVLVTGLTMFSLAAFSGFAGPKVSALVSKMQNQAQGEALGDYPGLSWEVVRQAKNLSHENESTRRKMQFEIPANASLIRIDVAGGCSLSNFRFAWQKEEDFTTGFGSRNFVGRSPSKTAYLPVIQTGDRLNSRLVIQGVSPECEPTLAVVPVVRGEQPIVGWLPRSCQFEEANTTFCPLQIEAVTATQRSFPTVKFEGYLAPEVLQPFRSYREEASSISAKVLGFTDQGYAANDVWVSKWRTTIDEESVRVSGDILRGALIVGVELDAVDRVSSPIPSVEYAVHGSIFNRGASRIGECFTIPTGERYRIFVGAVTDLYSPSWNSFRINEIQMGSPCLNGSDGEQWRATLEQ